MLVKPNSLTDESEWQAPFYLGLRHMKFLYENVSYALQLFAVQFVDCFLSEFGNNLRVNGSTNVKIRLM